MSLIRWDRKSTIYLSLFLTSIAVFCFFTMVDVRGYLIRHDSNWSVTIGQIQSVESMEGIEQTKAGNRQVTIGYKIKCSYKVDDGTYTKDYVFGSRIKAVTKFVCSVNQMDTVEIYYKKEDPDESYLNIDLGSGFYQSQNHK